MVTRAKILERTGTAFLCVMVAVAASLLVLHAFASSGRALPGGFRPLIVLSGSMEPAMPVGGVVITRSTTPSDVRAGDIITFALTHDLSGSSLPLATHRVVKVIDDGTRRGFVTKGDANASADPAVVPADRLVGRVSLVIPYLGHIARFVLGPVGLILTILLPGTVLLTWEGIQLARRRTKPLQSAAIALLVVLLCFVGAGQAGLASGHPQTSLIASSAPSGGPDDSSAPAGAVEEGLSR